MSKKIVSDSPQVRLWDEILKAIVDAMPQQLFPLFKEIYGKDYPRGTPITLLATESSTYRENTEAPPSSRLSDISLLVNGTDYYHLECQMRNEKDMVIRIAAYDLHFAMQYTAAENHETGMMVMRLPHSAVIYPEKNDALPDKLKCLLIFQDGSQHVYQIPTVRIQSYSLQEIHQKHLMLFIPYVLLRLRPRLDPKRKTRLTKKELTDFVREVIIILQEEVKQGYLTEQELNDYINLFRRASERIFLKHENFRKEVDEMTKPLIELPSVLQKRLNEENDSLKSEIKSLEGENKSLEGRNKSLEGENKSLEGRNKSLEGRNKSLIDENDTLLANLSKKDRELADKDRELARLKELLKQHHISAAM